MTLGDPLSIKSNDTQDDTQGVPGFHGIIGNSASMRSIFDLIQRVSKATANVLITGESGTGKEQVARALHATGPRCAHPFVPINCAALPEPLMESELFGHARGSFTGAHIRKKGLFAEAEGGTLFLDEIGDMNLALQAKLLRVLQERKIRAVGETLDHPINVRIIAATHQDLKVAVKKGLFREDLYYRLNVIPIAVPALRHRKEDIPLLAESFLKKFAQANHSQVCGFTSQAMTRLLSTNWDGNVRELENSIERAVVLCQGLHIDEKDLVGISEAPLDFLFKEISSRFPTVEEFERKYIQFILEKSGGRKKKAAQILGLNRRTLYRKERQYGFASGPNFTILVDSGLSDSPTPGTPPTGDHSNGSGPSAKIDSRPLTFRE